MSGRFVRNSSFRHVFGEAPKDPECFGDIKPAFNGDGDHLTASVKYWACATSGGGGPVQVGNMETKGRLGNQPRLAVHKAKVLDFAFHPFIDEMIATCSEDCYAMVTKFPEGGITKDTCPDGNISKCDVKLEGHQKKIDLVKFHPTANNVLATKSFDKMVKIWDIEAQSEIYSYDKHGDVPTSFDWNSNGSLCLTTCKDKTLRIFDPRAPDGTLECKGFEGAKKGSAVWLDNHQKIAHIGFSSNAARKQRLYDPRKFDKEIHEADIDGGAGVFMVTYDPDNSILYLAGKGDAGIKYYEITDEEPCIFGLSEFRDSESNKGIAWIPKRGCQTEHCEVMRALRLLRDKIQPVSLRVPRKSEIFQADLYPDAYAGVSGQSAADYQAGKNADAPTQSMDPKNAPGERKAQSLQVKRSPAELERLLEAAEKKIAELEAKLAAK
jgi:hypothetical protein